LAERALKKCIASRNPVAVEPGRYTVILEPQAVHDLVRFMASWLPRRFTAEVGFGPFAAGTREHPHESKVGQKIADDQITISYDPNDPALAVPMYDGVTPVTWVDHGILSVLGYGRDTYALQFMNRNVNQNGDGAYRIAEGNATIDEMIATTKRGLIVTRFSDVSQLEEKSVLLTGFTRDGLWLVENGKITKAVKNFRFTDSPLFMLNNVEQVGRPAVPVFSPDMPAVVPPIKARDFSFTSLIDAI
jgi:predicted Zn-dependent protease